MSAKDIHHLKSTAPHSMDSPIKVRIARRKGERRGLEAQERASCDSYGAATGASPHRPVLRDPRTTVGARRGRSRHLVVEDCWFILAGL